MVAPARPAKSAEPPVIQNMSKPLRISRDFNLSGLGFVVIEIGFGSGLGLGLDLVMGSGLSLPMLRFKVQVMQNNEKFLFTLLNKREKYSNY